MLNVIKGTAQPNTNDKKRKKLLKERRWCLKAELPAKWNRPSDTFLCGENHCMCFICIGPDLGL